MGMPVKKELSVTHVVATFGDAVCKFVRNITRNGASQTRFKIRLFRLKYLFELLIAANG